MSVDQREGIVPMHDNWDIDLGAETDTDGDPPRVWVPNKDKPGCAFTRSIGDATGERVGVISDPELTKKEIKEHDKARAQRTAHPCRPAPRDWIFFHAHPRCFFPLPS